jgi:hypothetical protein
MIRDLKHFSVSSKHLLSKAFITAKDSPGLRSSNRILLNGEQETPFPSKAKLV